MKYIALLRGVNVGGNNKLPMAELRAAFERHGFHRVSSYINSGNVLFESDITDTQALVESCERLIRDGFGMDVPVFIAPAAELAQAMRHAPTWWNEDAESKHNAIFVLPPATVADVYAQMGEINPDYEKLAFHGRVLFWSAPIRTFSRTKGFKLIGSSAYKSLTVRNANTALKLAALAGDEG